VLGSGEFDEPLALALARHEVPVPTRVDALIDFSPPRAFARLILEMKSGGQSYDAAVYQLKCYRAALSDATAGRMAMWAIIEDEGPAAGTVQSSQVMEKEPPYGSDDVWVFTPSSQIWAGVRALGLVETTPPPA
jgi:hypothetical protein